MARSIIQSEKVCWVCQTPYDLHDHHVFYGTANRKHSEKYGLKVWLCSRHHNMSNEGVHFNKALDLKLKQTAQKHYEQNIGTREQFRIKFGRSWL